MTELTQNERHYLSAVWELVNDGDIPLNEYKKLLGKYSKKAEQRAKENEHSDYEETLRRVSGWKKYRLEKVHEAEEQLQKAKDSLARVDEEIEEALAPFRK